MRRLLMAFMVAALLMPAHPSYCDEAGKDKRLATLMESMRDPDPMVRRAADSSLGEAATKEAVPLLEDVLGSDPDVMVRLTVLGALELIGDKSALPVFEKALNDPDPRVRQGAAHALSGSWGQSAHMALVNALKNEKSAKVRRSVAEALGNPGVMGRYQGHGWDGTAITQKALTEALKNDEDYGVRATAAQMLGKFKNGDSLRVLLEALEKDNNISARASAAEALGMLEMPTAAPALIDVVMFERDEMLVMSALKALKYYNDPRMEEAALAALESRSPKVKWQAIDVLEELRSQDAVEPLTRLADDEYESEGIRFKAKEALQLMGAQ